jgi:hypothetical protein
MMMDRLGENYEPKDIDEMIATIDSTGSGAVSGGGPPTRHALPLLPQMHFADSLPPPPIYPRSLSRTLRPASSA